jgi:hypothetical protein
LNLSEFIEERAELHPGTQNSVALAVKTSDTANRSVSFMKLDHGGEVGVGRSGGRHFCTLDLVQILYGLSCRANQCLSTAVYSNMRII